MNLSINSLAFNENKSWVSFSVGKIALIIDINQKSLVTKIEHPDSVSTMAFNKTGTWFVSGCEDKKVYLWKCEDWKLYEMRQAEKGGISHVMFSPNDDGIIYTDQINCYFLPFDPEAKREVKTIDEWIAILKKEKKDNSSPSKILLGHLSIITDICLSFDNNFLITSDVARRIRVAHYPNTYEIESFCFGHLDSVTCLGIPFSEKKPLLLSGGGQFDSCINLWNYETGKPLFHFPLVGPLEKNVISLSCCPVNPNLFAFILEDFTKIFLFQITENFEIKPFKDIELEKNQEKQILEKISFDSKGNLWIIGKNPSVRVFNYPDFKEDLDFQKETSKFFEISFEEEYEAKENKRRERKKKTKSIIQPGVDYTQEEIQNEIKRKRTQKSRQNRNAKDYI
ncbi:wd40 repeat protein [Anaeramoeba ignava]|uniref:Wd40 repeat protein n=1 Tax=Anaeramoeba ignava TaxID=1746090 RepID=A0A9Q0LBR1_ANAIG|nr:wd40 repeat protein [Anaeramoeba ignava]|eukprot:Anaeramoba_ignava/a221473_21.p1 GENE.a221473_21~~a221473_21.p1  ORF type:complete len:396 (-),score=139.00 a221473_21:60-1247(-)